MTAWMWLLVGILGLLALGGVMFYGQYRTTHPPPSRNEVRRHERGAHELYDETERERAERAGD